MEYKVSELFKEYEDIINKTIRSTNNITFSLEETKPWESKLGGCPYLESIKDYPLDEKGNPMMFLAQINLEDLIVRENPYEKDYKEYLPFIRNGKMHFTKGTEPVQCSLDKFDELFDVDSFTDEQENKISDEFSDEGSRVLGYPYFLQGEPAFYKDNNILLLQLDIDDTCGIMFGDSGNCNFFICEEDLLKRDFSNVLYDWQCC